MNTNRLYQIIGLSIILIKDKRHWITATALFATIADYGWWLFQGVLLRKQHETKSVQMKNITNPIRRL